MKMPQVLQRFAARQAHRHARQIAADFAGSTVIQTTNADGWGAGQPVFATTLAGEVRIEVSWTKFGSVMPLLFKTLGVVIPAGADVTDEQQVHTFYPDTYDGLFGLRHAYHKVTGDDLPHVTATGS